MKKNNKKALIVVAMVLMVALVAGMGAMTYSRYVSSYDVPAQTATAAQWGFVVTANANNLFSDAYAVDSSTYAEVVEYANGVAIKASAANNQIVAPGSTGSMTIAVNGKAEVLASLAFDIKSGYTDIHYGDYYPVKWTLKNGAEVIVENKKLSDVVTALQANNDTYNPGTTIALNYTLSWAWDFETGTTDAEKAANNIKDTIIGMLAAGKTEAEIKAVVGEGNYNSALGKSHTISFDMSVLVQQVQTIPTP